MDGIKRSLRYWGRMVETTVGMLLVFLVLFGLLYTIGADIGEAWKYIASYTPAVCVLSMCVMGFTGMNNYLPFTISMGSTRRDSFIGMEIMIHAMACQLAVLSVLAEFLQPEESKVGMARIVITCLFCSFFAAGLCNGIGAVNMKFGKIAGFVVYFIVAIGGMFGIVFAGSLLGLSLTQMFNSIWTVLAAVLLDLVAGVFCYLASRKIEVRA